MRIGNAMGRQFAIRLGRARRGRAGPEEQGGGGGRLGSLGAQGYRRYYVLRHLGRPPVVPQQAVSGSAGEDKGQHLHIVQLC